MGKLSLRKCKKMRKHFLKIYLFTFREKGWEGDKHWQVASHTPPTGDLAHNPGMCPDWESNWWLFCAQAGAQSTEPHLLRHTEIFKMAFTIINARSPRKTCLRSMFKKHANVLKLLKRITFKMHSIPLLFHSETE